jgi:uncharacterized protein (UPF0212 family)
MPNKLQFDRAEPTAGMPAGTMACKACGSLLSESYYVINGNIVDLPNKLLKMKRFGAKSKMPLASTAASSILITAMCVPVLVM